LLDGLAADAVLSAQQDAAFLDAVTLCRGWIAHDLSRLLNTLRKAFQRFDKQAPFWQK
jgi:hypothetical protein